MGVTVGTEGVIGAAGGAAGAAVGATVAVVVAAAASSSGLSSSLGVERAAAAAAARFFASLLCFFDSEAEAVGAASAEAGVGVAAVVVVVAGAAGVARACAGAAAGAGVDAGAGAGAAARVGAAAGRGAGGVAGGVAGATAVGGRGIEGAETESFGRAASFAVGLGRSKTAAARGDGRSDSRGEVGFTTGAGATGTGWDGSVEEAGSGWLQGGGGVPSGTVIGPTAGSSTAPAELRRAPAEGCAGG
jgi:hypothetical protein